ncbi:MAG: alpha/beta hydrolase [Candidatus Eremiobacteraeota bacterium]|nr:alpha/beta hydrolase [Candidatus Eremiobacteraeota bacterium]
MIASRTTTVAHDDGAATTVEHWGETGAVMLCVHGMASSRKSWTRLAQRYASRFRVVAYDQRGHGDSAAVRGPMSLKRGGLDLETVLQAIGGADVLVGHSWGGAVAVRGGLHAPVRAVAAVDPMIVQVDDAWYDEYLAELEESFVPTGSARDAVTRNDYADWHPDDIEGKVHAVHAMVTEPIVRLRTDNIDVAWDLRGDIATYERPLLLAMAGRAGTIVPPDVIADVERRHGDRVKIVTFENEGHNLYRSAFDDFAIAFDAFLNENQLA